MDESVKKKVFLATQRTGSQLRDPEPLVVAKPSEMRPRPPGGVAEIVPLGPSKKRPKASARKEAPKVPVDEHIGRHLRAVYDDVLNQPIPDRFLDLLNQLGSKTSKDEVPDER